MSHQTKVKTEAAEPVLQYTDARLRQVSAVVPETAFEGEKLRSWIERLNQSRKVYGGIGIAAPQIGILQRIVVIDIPAYERVGFGQVEAVPLHTLVNPEIIWYSEDKLKVAEGCLSVRGYEGFVVRPRRIRVVAFSPEGKRLEIEADSLYARCLQHEIDHLDGMLYPDRVTLLREIRKIQPVSVDDPILSHNHYIARPDVTLVL
ncbi:MAG: peptide deformylase [Chloroflexota bacterium]|nr:peptide deformylase [Chloroflexota bacterium]